MVPKVLAERYAIRPGDEIAREAAGDVYPTEATVRTALRGAAAYQLSRFDAHLWAYAEQFGLDRLLSEDFEHDRMHETVLAVDPFR